MTTFQAFLASRFPDARVTPLSDSNNLVYRVDTADQTVVAKHVIDTDIPVRYLADANAALASHLPVQRITEVFEVERGDPVDAVLADYVTGVDLVTALADGRAVLTPDRLAEYFTGFVAACADLPRMHEGFALYKRGAVAIDGYAEFVTHHARRYWGRARPFVGDADVVAAVNEWLDSGFAKTVARVNPAYAVVAIDANLRNFVLTDDDRIIALNVPIAALSTPAHGAGAISTHLRHTPAHAAFLDAAAKTVCVDDIDLVPHFEIWGLLGILSFYAVRAPEDPSAWRSWGSPVSLLDDFAEAAAKTLVGSARP